MTVHTADISRASYAGDAVLAAGADSDFYRYSVWRTPSDECNGVFVMPYIAGGRFTGLPDTIDSASAIDLEYTLAALLEDLHFDVAMCSLPIARDLSGTITGNGLSDPAPFDVNYWTEPAAPPHPPTAPHYGPAMNGNGLFVYATDSAFALPAGYDDVVHPMRDVTRPSCFMATTMFAQHIKHNLTALGWRNKTRGLFGGSWAAQMCQWLIYGPERATYHFPVGTGQDAETVRGFFPLAMVQSLQVYFPAFPNSFVLPGTAKSVLAGGDAHLDEQSSQISQATVGTLNEGSPLVFAQTNLEDSQRIYLHIVSNEPNPAQLQGADGGFDTTNTLKNCSTHSNWSAISLKSLHGDNAELVLIGVHAAEVAAMAVAGIDYTPAVDDADVLAKRMAWVAATHAIVSAGHASWYDMATAVRTKFKADVSDPLALVTQHDNQDLTPPDEDMWCRLAVLAGRVDQLERAGDEHRTYRTPGVAIASLFSPMSQGDHDLLSTADSILAAFKARTEDGVTYYSPSATPRQRDGAVWRINITIPFSIEDRG